MDADNIFTGKSIILSSYYYFHDVGWETVEEYPRNGYVWEFEPQRQIGLPSGTAFEGMLKEKVRYSPEATFEYAYCPSRHLLSVERFGNDPDPFFDRFSVERYRVGHIRRNEYWFYDILNAADEPEGYIFRMRVVALKDK